MVSQCPPHPMIIIIGEYRIAGICCEEFIFANFAIASNSQIFIIADIYFLLVIRTVFCAPYCCCAMSMSLYSFFKPKESQRTLLKESLPDPQGPLSEDVPSLAISEANKEVLDSLQSTKTKKKDPTLKFPQN